MMEIDAFTILKVLLMISNPTTLRTPFIFEWKGVLECHNFILHVKWDVNESCKRTHVLKRNGYWTECLSDVFWSLICLYHIDKIKGESVRGKINNIYLPLPHIKSELMCELTWVECYSLSKCEIKIKLWMREVKNLLLNWNPLIEMILISHKMFSRDTFNAGGRMTRSE